MAQDGNLRSQSPKFNYPLSILVDAGREWEKLRRAVTRPNYRTSEDDNPYGALQPNVARNG